MTNGVNNFNTNNSVSTITTDSVRAVYSGRPGCMCGCRGNYRYNPQHVEEASVDRGYVVKPSEVNIAQVTRVLHIVQAAPAERVEVNSNCIYTEVNGRAYALYLCNARFR